MNAGRRVRPTLRSIPTSPRRWPPVPMKFSGWPMRGYFSTDDGATWGGVDLPLPAAIGANGTRFGSDPSLTFDTRGNVFYSYIVVFFSNGRGKGTINGTEMAVARSSDGGVTYPNITFFSFSGGQDHFNDKPMITADTNLKSAFRDNVYVAWDAASGGSGDPLPEITRDWCRLAAFRMPSGPTAATTRRPPPAAGPTW
jgi:hypothetical protein